MSPSKRAKAWDPLVRVFHWSPVAGFTPVCFSGEAEARLHAWTAYPLGGLLLAAGLPHDENLIEAMRTGRKTRALQADPDRALALPGTRADA